MKKSATTFIAIAALVAGLSTASAQNAGGPAPSGSSPGNINAGAPSSTAEKGQSGSESGGTAMRGSGTQRKIVSGHGQYCMTTAAGSNGLDCRFASMAACQKEAKTMSRQCAPNPNIGGTTGMK